MKLKFRDKVKIIKGHYRGYEGTVYDEINSSTYLVVIFWISPGPKKRLGDIDSREVRIKRSEFVIINEKRRTGK